MSSLIRIGRRKAVGLLLGLVVLGLAYLAWGWLGLGGLMAVTLVTVLAGIATVGYMLAAAERTIRGEQAFHAYTTQDLIRAVEQRSEAPGEYNEALLRAMNGAYRRFELQLLKAIQDERKDEARKATNRDKTENKRLAAELDAILQVHRLAGFVEEAPLMGGFALSPRGMLQVMSRASEPGVRTVVECGSGASTVYIARMLQLKGEGRLIALEHLERYAEVTDKALAKHELQDVAEVRLAPLEEVEIDGTTYWWYSVSALAGIEDVDMVLVDGPPKDIGPEARFPAVPLLLDSLAPNALVVLDDTDRRDEAHLLARLLSNYPLVEGVSSSPDQSVLRLHQP